MTTNHSLHNGLDASKDNDNAMNTIASGDDHFNAVPKGDHQNGVLNEDTGSNPHKVQFNSNPAYAARSIRVITIGAGFSGLMLAHKFQHQYPEMQRYVSHTIFEQRHQIGGTWLVHTYPGVQCDVPSHIYVSIRIMTLHIFNRCCRKSHMICYNKLTSTGFPFRP